MLSQQDAPRSGRLNPADQQQQVGAPTDAAAPGAAAASQASATRAAVEASTLNMSCALCPQGLANPFLQAPPPPGSDDLDALQAAEEVALAANAGPGATPTLDDYCARNGASENVGYFNYPDNAFSTLGFGLAADYLGLADDATNSKAHYMSANCVVFTNYSSGDAAAEVDEHFSRALGTLHKDQNCDQAILGKSSVFELKNRLMMGGCSNFGGSLTSCPTPMSSKKHASTLQLPGSLTSLNHCPRSQPWPSMSGMCPPPTSRPLPSYNAFNAYWSGQYHSVSCPNTPLQHPTAPGQQAFQFNASITTGSSNAAAVAPQQRDYWY